MYNKLKSVSYQNLIRQIEFLENRNRVGSMLTRARYRKAVRDYIRFLEGKLNENNR